MTKEGVEGKGWTVCMTCMQYFTGTMQLQLAWRRWARVREEPETSELRLGVAMNLSSALHGQGRYALSAAMDRKTLEMQKRVLGKEHTGTSRYALHNCELCKCNLCSR